MSATPPAPPIFGSIVQDVMLVDRLTRSRTGPFRSASLPGHLIHVVVSGQVEQSTGGVTQRFGAGQSIWYHEDEPVRGHVLKTPWTFYTVNFHAPRLPPPPPDQRVGRVSAALVRRMDQLLRAWRQTDAPEIVRRLRVHALLSEILSELIPAEAHSHSLAGPTQLWWCIESELRRDLSQQIDLTLMQRISRHSQRNIIRACHLATGLPPMKRVKALRLSYGRGLVRYSDLSMSQIALRLGYGRVQEFSRDYHQHFDSTPSGERRGRNWRLDGDAD
ncbi:MAG: helix-turn-helix transcriptional regulator [Phycisphaeraceae bacterium]|nr:helix-turn-helix transcriptional regulator [Phycisphaeraceae bacterium]